jgi:major membrane immunogen (membrane-anchored lipoprotein)
METAIRELIEKYREAIVERDDELNPYRDEEGDVRTEDLTYYDEDRANNAFAAEVDLITLLDELEELFTEKESK